MIEVTDPPRFGYWCKHCKDSGYRDDRAPSMMHRNPNSEVAKRCDSGERPCKRHQCYWFDTQYHDSRKIGQREPDAYVRDAEQARLLALDEDAWRARLAGEEEASR